MSRPMLAKAVDHELTSAEIGVAFGELEALYRDLSSEPIDLVLSHKIWRVVMAHKPYVTLESSRCVEVLLTRLERKWSAQIEADERAERAAAVEGAAT